MKDRPNDISRVCSIRQSITKEDNQAVVEEFDKDLMSVLLKANHYASVFKTCVWNRYRASAIAAQDRFVFRQLVREYQRQDIREKAVHLLEGMAVCGTGQTFTTM